MLKILFLFVAGYMAYKFFQFKKLLFGDGLKGRSKKESTLGIREEDIREAEFNEIDKEES
ncbi:MAG: hypothetical protein CMG71_05825 [Candidatus Marinimicrobia bacterium]|nr:hypothetical protein [Candidatus Neomarinimicrobiota bacterium]